MKSNKINLKIEQRRKNKDSRLVTPFDNFLVKIKRSQRLLKKIEKIKDKINLNEALIHSVISDITAFEVYFRDVFQVVFTYRGDEKEIIAKCLEANLSRRKFDFDDMYTLPEIILLDQSFQKLKNIETVFSKITGEEFFEILPPIMSELPELDLRFDKNIGDNCYPKLENYFDLRHNLVHDFNPKLRLDRLEIEDLHWNLYAFVWAADIYLINDFIPKNFKNKIKRYNW